MENKSYYKGRRFFESDENSQALKESPPKKDPKSIMSEQIKILDFFLNSTNEIFCFVDEKFLLQEINKTGLENWKVKKSDVIGRSFLDVCPYIKKSGRYEKLLYVMETGKPLTLDGIECPRSSKGYVNIRALKIGNGIGMVIVGAKKGNPLYKNSINSPTLLRSLSSHLQSLREEESRRIARELHDEMAPALTTLKMNLSWISSIVSDTPNVSRTIIERIGSMTELIDLTFDSLQKLCSELRPALLDDFGLVPAIEWRLEEFQKHSDIRCSFSTNCEDINLHSDQVICLFRIFQEALTNVIRHANATEISVSFLLKAQSNSLELKIRDDGKGITWEQISSLKSFGLIGMRERLHPFNGRLEIMGIPDEGTILTAILPLREGEVVK